MRAGTDRRDAAAFRTAARGRGRSCVKAKLKYNNHRFSQTYPLKTEDTKRRSGRFGGGKSRRMVKGVSRRVVVVRPERGDLFEQAIFIVRDGEREGRSPDDILREACVIAEECTHRRRSRVLPALMSAAAGAAAVGAAWLTTAIIF